MLLTSACATDIGVCCWHRRVLLTSACATDIGVCYWHRHVLLTSSRSVRPYHSFHWHLMPVPLWLVGVGRDSSFGIATRYGLDDPGIESRRRARFIAPVQTGPGADSASCTVGTGSFPGVKRPGRDVDHPPPSSAEVRERVELYLYSPSRPSWAVVGWTVPSPLPLRLVIVGGGVREAEINFVHSPSLKVPGLSEGAFVWVRILA